MSVLFYGVGVNATDTHIPQKWRIAVGVVGVVLVAAPGNFKKMQLYANVLMHGYYSKIGAHKQTSFNNGDTGSHNYKA